jgi:hypothetical protein
MSPPRPFIVERVKRRAGAPPERPLIVAMPAITAPPAPELSRELEQLAERIGRMPAIGRNGDMDPFFEARSRACRDARDLADWHRTGRAPAGYVPAVARQVERRTAYRERH